MRRTYDAEMSLAKLIALYMAIVLVIWQAWQQVAVPVFKQPPLSFGQAILAVTAMLLLLGAIGIVGKVL